MISYNEAHKIVLNSVMNFGTEIVSIEESIGRVLAENIVADRDFPPFNRVTKDGIAINFKNFKDGGKFKIRDVAAAGSTEKTLNDLDDCIEVMTGAMLPVNTDTVIMYEDLSIADGVATINSKPAKFQNIHFKGSDQKQGLIVLAENFKINSQSIGLLATVGKSTIKVKKLPSVAIISTGNELVPIQEIPKPHQIRSSNSISLKLLLKKENVDAKIFHIPDNKALIKSKLDDLINKFDVIMMSGGVSMGKFDFLPEILEELKIIKLFHKVAQRPGKPIWFGQDESSKTTIFSFPGNPVSTYVNYHIYFKDWLNKCLGQNIVERFVNINLTNDTCGSITLFRLVRVVTNEGKLTATTVNNNGSGDLASISKATGVIEINNTPADNDYKLFRYISF